MKLSSSSSSTSSSSGSSTMALTVLLAVVVVTSLLSDNTVSARLVGGIDESTNNDGLSFPRLVSINTTRHVASSLSGSHEILRGNRHNSRRDSTGSDGAGDSTIGEMVDLTLLVHHAEQWNDLEQLRSEGLLTVDHNNNHNHDRNNRLLQKVPSDLAKDRPCYRTVQATYESMHSLAEQYPELVTIQTIGQSYQQQVNGGDGHDLLVMILTAPSVGRQLSPKKSDMMIVAGHHSRELPPPELVLRWAEQLVRDYGTDADTTWILDHTQIHVVPLANPDGRQIVWDHPDWMYRKNGRPNSCPYGAEGWGTDLNRNYPFHYGNDEGSSDDPCSDAYRGDGPLSEPESWSVYKYAKNLFAADMKKGTVSDAFDKQQLACPADATGLYVDIHSYGDFVYFPWGFEDAPCPNHHPLLTLSAKLAHAGDYALWGPEQDGYLYFVSGDATDATYGIDCIASVGFEIGTSFTATCDEFEQDQYPVMSQSLLYAAKTVSAPYRIPLGPDVLSLSVSSSTANNELQVEATVSDEALIVDHAYFSRDFEKSQAIAKVLIYVDIHPLDGGIGAEMIPADGTLDSVQEDVTIVLDTSGWITSTTTGGGSGRHILYVQAIDTAGYAGAVSAVFVDATGALTSSTKTEKTTTETRQGGGGGWWQSLQSLCDIWNR